MNSYDFSYNENILNDFASKQWEKSLGYLNKHFSLALEDCEDIFQESFITLYENVKSGKIEKLTSSLSSYFIGVCRNKALEFIRKHSKSVTIDDELSLSIVTGEIDEEKLNFIISLDGDDNNISEMKNKLTCEIVKSLPSPCDKLLWGYYRDNLSMKTLAQMFGYKSESAVKVTKHRCCEKFRKYFNERYKAIL